MTILGGVPPLLAGDALGANWLTLQSQMARATFEACYLLSSANFVCKTNDRVASWIVQNHAGILLRRFHDERNLDGLVYCEVGNFEKSGLQCGDVDTAY